MAINFNPDRWEKVVETHEKWWEGTLKRPLLPIVVPDATPQTPKHKGPVLSQANCTDLLRDPEDILDAYEYELSKQNYLGDAFPYINMDCFGPGIVAAFLGAKVNNITGNVWFETERVLPINELHFEYDPDNIWLKRVCQIYDAAMKRWKGQVAIGMTDLGGVMDILATFRTTEGLAYDFYDEPEEVVRCMNEIHNLWHRYYRQINEIMKPYTYGYTDWSGLFSKKTTYVMQCDYSYMISPSVFEDFARDELVKTTQKLERSLYHLDGIGALTHLDSLLDIETLDAIQWIPGANKGDADEWLDVYKKIAAKNKKIQLCYIANLSTFDKVANEISDPSLIQLKTLWTRERKEAEAFLLAHGASI
jgi:5-methyltetrahydrofolate--homocysteine methyltransferase